MQDIFLILAQSQFWRWERIILKTKKKDVKLVQGSLRPTILGCYEYVFPEEALSEVLSVFGVPDYNTQDFKISVLRKIFGCKKIPEKNLKEAKKIPNVILVNGSQRGLSNVIIEGAGFYPIGIKKDRRGEMYGYLQEAL